MSPKSPMIQALTLALALTATIANTHANDEVEKQEDLRAFGEAIQADPALAIETAFEPLASEQHGEEGTLVDVVEDDNGEKTRVELLGELWMRRTVGRAFREFRRKENQASIYRVLHEALPESSRAKFIDPDQVKNGRSMEDINKLIKRALKLANLSGAGAEPALVEPVCENEVGYELGSDLASKRNDRWSRTGLIANVSFPLRNHQNCIRSQGHRGTCVSFGITAGVENELARSHNLRINLSEQHLYYWAKVDSTTIFLKDGLSTLGIMKALTREGYPHQLESTWNYNPSSRRKLDAEKRELNGSCEGYEGEMCSETTHQAEQRCFEIGDVKLVCKYTAPFEPSEYRIQGVHEIWNTKERDFSLKLAKAYLAAGRPIVGSLSTTKNFKKPKSGYVTYEPNEERRGGHAVLLIGWIENERLPRGAPEGSGGGYFVIRNSWGTRNGDRGYFYVPYDWAKTYFKGMGVIEGVSR